MKPLIILNTELIRKTIDDKSVDYYKIGKLNNYKGLDKRVDWTKFFIDCVTLLRQHNKQIYIKKSLQPFANGIILTENGIDAERLNVKNE